VGAGRQRPGPMSLTPLQARGTPGGRYILGDGPRCFVVGYGRRPPARPHHRGASCPPPPAPCNFTALHAPGRNPHVLRGALVGGPHPDDSFADDRAEYAKSEARAPAPAAPSQLPFLGSMRAVSELGGVGWMADACCPTARPCARACAPLHAPGARLH